MSTRLRHLPPVILLLLIYAFARLHNLSALPLFVDESFHLNTAQAVWDGELLRGAADGRLGHVWVNALVGPQAPAGGWAIRVGIVLAGLVGVTAFYALVRGIVSHRAGLIAIALWIATPYLVFFERIAVADSLLHPLSVVAVWIAWQMMQRRSRWLAAALGVALVGLMLAKLSGVVWLPLPLVAVILMTSTGWRERLILAGLSYGTFAALWLPFAAVVRAQGYDYMGVATVQTGGYRNLEDRLFDNIEAIWQIDVAYLSLPLIVAAVAGGLFWLWRQPRPALFALLVLGMPSGAAAALLYNINSRYALDHVVWVLLPLAVGIGLLIRRRPRWEPLIYGALALWIAVFYVSFQLDAWNDPADLALHGNDPREYLSGESSGYGVTAAGEWISANAEPLPVIGLVANCQTLRLAAHPQDVACPDIRWEGSNQAELMASVAAQAASGPVIVVGEALIYLDLAGLPEPNTSLLTFERPRDGVPVTVFRVEQGAQVPAN
jgi:4-amino-4-deoxy-L-arabinose transferase-like glycosyltransferase